MISVLVFLGHNNVVYTVMKLKAIIGHSGYLSNRVACAFPNFDAKKRLYTEELHVMVVSW